MNCPGKAILLALSLVLLSRMQWANGHAAPFNQKAVQQERKNETEQEHPANNGMSVVGSVIDLGSFRYTRSIIGGRPGLSLLSLDAAVLAHSRLDDLRIAQPDGHQIPYLLEKADEPFSMDLPAIEKTEPPESSSFVGRNRSGTWSYYRLRLPYADLPEADLIFTTSESVFRRHVSILIERNPSNERQEPWTKSIAQAIWSHADPETEAPELILAIPKLNTAEVMVAVEEGDNTPLPITSARLRLPAYRLRFFCEADLRLYYGRYDLNAPQYDLAMLKPQLLEADAEEVHLGPEIEIVPLETRSLSPVIFWGILVGAVIILLILITRLVKKA